MINIILIVITSFIFSFIFLLLDKNNLNKNKILYLILTFIIGMVGAYITYRFEMHFGSYFKKVKDSTYLEILFYAIFGVAIFEEGYKFFIPFISCIKNKIISSYDILLYCAFSSIGFALAENILFYAPLYSNSIMLNRMIVSFPSHICFASFMAYFLYKYKNSKSNIKYSFLLMSLIIPTLVHAIYNSFLYGGDQTLKIYHNIYCLIIFIISIIIIRYLYKKKN